MKTFNNVAQLKLANLITGELVSTKGYHTDNDGGQANYIIKTLVEFSAVPNEKSDISLANTNVAVLANTGVWNLKQFGATALGVVDDTASVLAWSLKGGNLFIPRGLYRITNQIVFPPASHVYGESSGVGTGGSTLTELEEAAAGASVIRVSNDFLGSSVFKFVDLNWKHNGSVNAHDFKIRNDLTDGADAHLLEVINGYDNVSLVNLNLLFSNPAFNALRMTNDVTIDSAEISQTILMQNLVGIHSNDTAPTAPTLYMRHQQEVVMNGVKMFGAGFNNPDPTAIPMALEGCRGVAMTGCSSALTEGFGIHVYALARATDGISIVGHTFEDCRGGTIYADGSNVSAGATVSRVYVINPRYQFPQPVGFTIEHATSCKIDNALLSGILTGNTTENNVIETNQLAKISDVSTRVSNLIISYPNALGEKLTYNANLTLKKDAATIKLTTADGTKTIRIASGQSGTNDFGFSIINEFTGAAITLDQYDDFVINTPTQGGLRLKDEAGNLKTLRLTSSNTVVVS